MSYHDPTGDLLSFRQFCLIADKIEADPGLLQISLANMTRWLGNGHWAVRELAQWREWVEAAQHSPDGLSRLLDLLRDDSGDARDWKGYDPFPGILTESELQKNSWTSRH